MFTPSPSVNGANESIWGCTENKESNAIWGRRDSRASSRADSRARDSSVGVGKVSQRVSIPDHGGVSLSNGMAFASSLDEPGRSGNRGGVELEYDDIVELPIGDDHGELEDMGSKAAGCCLIL